MCLCAMTKSCKSFHPDNTGDCMYFASTECRFISDHKYAFACEVCIHNLTKHVDPRCKECKLKDAMAFAPSV